jgi:hypothetical protein
MLPTAAGMLAQTAPPPAAMSGTVTNSVTGEPILRAHVTVECMTQEHQQQAIYGALTNAKGEFTITQLPPGPCTPNARRVGFVELLNRASYSLTSGARKEGVKLTLTPAGAITGHVFDGSGEPAQGVGVTAEGPGGNSANAATDDKGQFRLGGLRPGKYRVKAAPQTLPFPPEIRSDGAPQLHDAATYYPGSTTAKSAQRLEVKAGADVSAIDIRLARTPVVTVSGKVTGLPAGFKNAMVSVVPAGQNGGVKADGTFTIWQLDPGKQTVMAMYYAGGSTLMSAPLEIQVTTANLEHLELRMVPPFDIAGQLRFEDPEARQPPQPPSQPGEQTPPAPPPRALHLQLRPLQLANSQEAHAPVGADDSFTLERVQPGRYHVGINWGSGYVKSVRAGDTETQGDILDVRNGSAGPLTVTVSSNFCEVSGTLNDSRGPVRDAPVLLESVEDPMNVRVMHTDASGAYKFDALPPGHYKLAPVDESVMTWGPDGPDLEDFEEVTESLDLSPGDKISKELRQRK